MSAADVAVLHHRGAYAPWSVDEGRPLATGADRAATHADLVRRGVADGDARAMLDLAAARGSSVVVDGVAVSASQAIEGNAAGAFDEEVPVEDVFRHLLLDRRPLP